MTQAEALPALRPLSRLRFTVRFLRRLPLVPVLIILTFAVMAAVPQWLTDQDPLQQSLRDRFQPPAWMEGGSWDDPLGTDSLGRDLLVRIIYGARTSMIVAAITMALGGVGGLFVGMISGYFGGWIDALLMRATDAAMAIPTIFLALLFAVALEPSLQTVIIAISLVIWARFSRVIRGEVLRIRNADFVSLAKVAGRPTPYILRVHIFPNLVNIWIVLLSLEIGAVIIIEAILGFLGAGIPPPEPSWGALVSSGRDHISSRWWLAIFPGVAIALAVLAFNMFGDWLRDVLDPRLRQV